MENRFAKIRLAVKEMLNPKPKRTEQLIELKAQELMQAFQSSLHEGLQEHEKLEAFRLFASKVLKQAKSKSEELTNQSLELYQYADKVDRKIKETFNEQRAN